LYFGALERLIHAYLGTLDQSDRVLIDLTRIGSIDEATRRIMFRFASEQFRKGKRIVLVDPGRIFTAEERRSLVPMAFVYDDCDEALEDAEENLLAQFDVRADVSKAVPFREMFLLQGIDDAAFEFLDCLAEECRFAAGELIIRRGTDPEDVHFLSKGLVGVLLPSEAGGPPRQVSSFTPGMSFGELSFIQGQTRTADVSALTAVETFSLHRDALMTFREHHPKGYNAILENVIQSLSERLIRANREVAALK
jgi:glutaminase